MAKRAKAAQELYDMAYDEGFKDGVQAMQQAAVQMLARAKQSAAALGVNLMQPPTPKK